MMSEKKAFKKELKNCRKIKLGKILNQIKGDMKNGTQLALNSL